MYKFSSKDASKLATSGIASIMCNHIRVGIVFASAIHTIV